MGGRDTSGTDDRNYRIEVADFGPIESADVEFRPLTVFLGPSNTGKSYLATLNYAVHRSLTADYVHSPWRAFTSFQSTRDREQRRPPESNVVDELESWVGGFTESGVWPRFSDHVVRTIRREIENASGLGHSLSAEIVRSFGSEGVTDLVRRPGPAEAEVIVAPSDSVDGGSLRYRMRLAEETIEVSGELLGSVDSLAGLARALQEVARDRLRSSEMFTYRFLELDSLGDDRGRAWWSERILRVMAAWALEPLLAPLRRRAYYLPADRTGIMHSHKMVVSALVQSAATAGLRRTPDVPKLSGVLTDFLEELIQMGDRDGRRRTPASGATIATQLEKSVLEGTVRVDASETNYPQFLYRPKGWSNDLALMRSSSMVSELAPLVLYLRRIVRRGDVLIIEEPESHLHPAMQIEVIKWVASIVRAGIRVVVTTHSDWVLDGLANIVQAARIDGHRVPEGDGGPVLRPEEVGVWRFSPNGAANGVTVKEITIDDCGMYPSGIDEVSAKVHNQWADIESKVGDVS